MLSVLIPTYNYNAFPLVEEIQQQCTKLQIEFEILVYNDGGKLFLDENAKINTIENCQFIDNQENIGRTQSRNFLAQKSKYNWLLFLDADVLPVNSDFINQYIKAINTSYSVFCGGYNYKIESKTESTILRYKYGVKRESLNAFERNKNPYTYIFSGNILIQKKCFLKANYSKENNYYGMDIYFSYQLMILKIDVVHIDNPIFHLGLETNEFFFDKCIQSVKSRKALLLEEPKIEEMNNLLKYYKTICNYKLKGFTSLIFKAFEPLLKKMILSKSPSLIGLDLYRLGYLCTLK